MQEAVDLLRSCGIELRDGQRPQLHTSTALFRYKLSTALRSTPAATQQVSELVDELLAAHDDITLYLDPVSLAEPQADGGFGQQAESLVRLLLGVDALQPELIRALLDKFSEFVGDQPAEDTQDDMGGAGETKVSVKILRQLRWLDYVVDPAALSEKLLETLGFVTLDMQREIIGNLANIVSDGDNAEVARVLAGMLNESGELMLPILEALGSLGCPAGVLQEARNAVLAHVVSAEPMDLPVMVRFLLQSVAGDQAAATIQRLRRRLDLDSLMLTRPGHASRAGGAQKESAAALLLFDVLATTLRGNRTLGDAWLRIISDAGAETANTGSTMTLDLIVLLILHPTAAYTRRVERVLRSRINTVVVSGSSDSSDVLAFTPQVVGEAIGRLAEVFAANFGALMAVASGLVRSSARGSQEARVAGAMVVAAFGHMGMFQRQEIAGELAAHIGSGNADEVDTAARIFLELARKYPWELRPFAVFIKGLLDYVDNLKVEHVRVVFSALGILATLNTLGSADDGLFSDLHIYVRKQLSSTHARYNRIGIIGTVALLRQLGGAPSAQTEGREAGEEADSQAGTSTSAHGQPANVHALRRGVQLLEMLVDAGRHQSWAFVSMTYDELAHLVESQGLHVQLLTWLHENVASTFAALFLCDREELDGQGQGGCVALALEDDEPAVLDILRRSKDAADVGLLCSEEQRLPREAPRLRGCLLACLPSLMRLVQACEKALAQGSLADIDALLVCGMHVLPPLSDDDDVANNADALAHADEDVRLAHTSHMLQWTPTRRRVACSALYVAANWVRELVNAFADQRAPGMRPRVLRRVDQLAHLEACMLALGKSLAGTPLEFHPPVAGLLPEFADSPARAAGAAAEARGLRIAPQGSVPSDQGAVQTLDIGGLLLSQQDTRTFVDAPLDTTGLAALATAQDTAKRGRKRKSGSVPAPFDDFLRTPHRFLRELSLPAYTGVLVLPDADEPPADAAAQLTVCALDLVLRELLAVVRGKLVRHAEKRTPAAVHKPLGSWASFGSGVQACGAQEFASILLRLLPALLRHLHRCLAARARFLNDLEQTPLLLHIQSHRPALALTTAREALLADRCIDALLHIVSAVLHWDGLQNSATAGQQSSVLLAVLRVVAAHNMHVDAQAIGDMGAEQLVRCAFDHLLALAQVVATGVRATLLLRMLLAVRAFAPTCESPREVCGMPAAQRRETMDGRISHLAHRILSAEFADQDADDGKPELGFLITTHILRCPHSRLHLVHAYATETLAGHFNPQQQEATHEPQGVHARLTHSTFATYYAATMGALGETMEAAGVGNMAPHEALGFAARAADSWLALTKLTQTTPLSLQRPVLKAALRGSLRLIDLFVRHILPVLDAQLFAQRSQVLAVFSVVQKSTRILQNICNHSKVAKDVGLQASVPQVKRRLEQLVFQVVALMERNDCVAAINLGNLKHRDITGQVVGSQIPPSQRYSDTEDEQEEEEEEEEEDGLGLDTMLAREQEEEEEDEGMPPVRRMRAARPPVPMTTAAAKKHALVVGRKRLLAHRREQRAREALRKHRRRSRDQDEEEEEAEDQDQDEDEEQEED